MSLTGHGELFIITGRFGYLHIRQHSYVMLTGSGLGVTQPHTQAHNVHVKGSQVIYVVPWKIEVYQDSSDK